MIIEIDGSSIRCEQDIHEFLSRSLDFGPYYGANMSALWDRLSTDVERPLKIIWSRSSESRAEMGDEQFQKIRDLLLRVQEQDESLRLSERFTVTFE